MSAHMSCGLNPKKCSHELVFSENEKNEKVTRTKKNDKNRKMGKVEKRKKTGKRRNGKKRKKDQPTKDRPDRLPASRETATYLARHRVVECQGGQLTISRLVDPLSTLCHEE